jgi:hypothetical protein
LLVAIAVGCWWWLLRWLLLLLLAAFLLAARRCCCSGCRWCYWLHSTSDSLLIGRRAAGRVLLLLSWCGGSTWLGLVGLSHNGGLLLKLLHNCRLPRLLLRTACSCQGAALCWLLPAWCCCRSHRLCCPGFAVHGS